MRKRVVDKRRGKNNSFRGLRFPVNFRATVAYVIKND